VGRYDEDIRTADELLREAGEACVLRVFDAVVPDPAKPWEPGAPTQRTQPVVCAFLDFGTSSGSPGGQVYFQNELVVRGDKKVLISALALDFAPSLGCQLERKSGELWTVVALKDLNPNGQHVLYTLQVRQ
jgi:hypothetical protein